MPFATCLELINIMFIIFREEYFKTVELRWKHQKRTYHTGKRCPAYPGRYPVESPRSNCCCLCLARYIIGFFIVNINISSMMLQNSRIKFLGLQTGSVVFITYVQYQCDYVNVHEIFTYLSVHSGGSRSLKPGVGATLKHLG